HPFLGVAVEDDSDGTDHFPFGPHGDAVGDHVGSPDVLQVGDLLLAGLNDGVHPRVFNHVGAKFPDGFLPLAPQKSAIAFIQIDDVSPVVDDHQTILGIFEYRPDKLLLMGRMFQYDHVHPLGEGILPVTSSISNSTTGTNSALPAFDSG